MLVCADMRRAMAAAAERRAERIGADAARTSTTGPTTRSTSGSRTPGPRRLYGWALEFPTRP